MKNEFVLALNEVLEEKQLPKEIIMQAIEEAMVSAYRKAVNASGAQLIKAKIDPESGKISIFAEKEVVEVVQDPRTEVSLEEARRIDPNAQLGSTLIVESTPKEFGRIAAQNARQTIQQKIREAERQAQFEYFSKQLGEIVSGVVQAVNQQGVTVGLDLRAEGLMPPNQQIPGEKYRIHDRIRALLIEVKETSRGPQLILSRAHRNFLRRLLENEVPEIYHGLVEIRSIAREPGQRSKVAVAALQSGIDPVGACVGIRGVRIQAIVRELNNEKIDVIEWNSDQAAYIAKALSPARVTGVYLDEFSRGTKTATVVVPEDQLSLTIGKDGQNARLAAKLTGWRIDIKSLPEAAADALYKLQKEPEYAWLAEKEAETIPQIEHILAKKSEGRPVTPEEYTLLAQFVDRVERGIIGKRQVSRKAEKERRDAIRATIPSAAFATPLDELDLDSRWLSILSESGYSTIGDLMLQMKIDPDAILAMDGIGPKAMEAIETALASLSFAEPEAIEQPIQEPELEALKTESTSEEVLQPEIAQPIVEATLETHPEISEPEPSAPTEEEGILVATTPLPLEAFEGPSEEEQTIAAVTPESEGLIQPSTAEQTSQISEDLFTLKPEVFEYFTAEDFEDESEEIVDVSKKKKKKKKKKLARIEYDPDQDITIVKPKHKRGGESWDEDWDY
jgi:N utilization substance protein A